MPYSSSSFPLTIGGQQLLFNLSEERSFVFYGSNYLPRYLITFGTILDWDMPNRIIYLWAQHHINKSHGVQLERYLGTFSYLLIWDNPSDGNS